MQLRSRKKIGKIVTNKKGTRNINGVQKRAAWRLNLRGGYAVAAPTQWGGEGGEMVAGEEGRRAHRLIIFIDRKKVLDLAWTLRLFRPLLHGFQLFTDILLLIPKNTGK